MIRSITYAYQWRSQNFATARAQPVHQNIDWNIFKNSVFLLISTHFVCQKWRQKLFRLCHVLTLAMTWRYAANTTDTTTDDSYALFPYIIYVINSQLWVCQITLYFQCIPFSTYLFDHSNDWHSSSSCRPFGFGQSDHGCIHYSINYVTFKLKLRRLQDLRKWNGSQ